MITGVKFASLSGSASGGSSQGGTLGSSTVRTFIEFPPSNFSAQVCLVMQETTVQGPSQDFPTMSAKAFIYRYNDATGVHLTEGYPAFVTVTSGTSVEVELDLSGIAAGVTATALLTVFLED